MVNPRWRPTIANSRSTSKSKLKDDRKDGFDLPAPEEYIGTHIKGDLGGVKVSNKSYRNYYKKNDLMDPLTIVSKLQRLMRDNLQRVGDAMISGGVDNMEKYQYMLGQARTYQYMLQEISNLLKAKEQKQDEGNVIDLGKGSPKA